MRVLALFGALLGFGLGTQAACNGNCADTGSHNCCAGSHCDCNGPRCHCQTDPGSHDCLVAPAAFECSVTWISEDGESLGVDDYLYENFYSPLAVVDTCNAQQDDNPDRPAEAVSAVCACTQIDYDTPSQLNAPS